MIKGILSKLIVLIVLALISLSAVTNIDNLVISGDSLDTLRTGFYLANHNVISRGQKDNNGDFILSNKREPLPTVITALWIKVNPVLASIKSVVGFQKGKVLELLKFQNIILLLALLYGVFVLSNMLLATRMPEGVRTVLSLISCLMVFNCLHHFYLNTLLTDLHAAVLIIWFSLAWIEAINTNLRRYYMISGILLGMLMLTKASFVYVGILSVSFYIIWQIISRDKKQNIVNQSFVLLLSLLMIMPWYLRNYYYLGAWEFTQRGPAVIYARSVMNGYNGDEFYGAFYAFSPLSLKPLMSILTGFDETDRLDGHKLQRLSRFPAGDVQKRIEGDEEGAISYFMKAAIHREKIRKEYYERYDNERQARLLADKQIKTEALANIKDNYLAHLRTSLVFAWRGAWPANTVDGRWSEAVKAALHRPVWTELLTFFGLISMFFLFFLNVFRLNKKMVALTTLGVASFGFYSLLTHFIPRYSEMFIPLWVLCAMYGVVHIVSKLFSKFGYTAHLEGL